MQTSEILKSKNEALNYIAKGILAKFLLSSLNPDGLKKISKIFRKTLS
jgi:hypothetical protein